ATSRASPLSRSAVILVLLSDQGTQFVLEPAGLDRAVDPALLRSVYLPPPAAVAAALTWRERARAGRAANRGIAPVVQRVVGNAPLADVVPDLVLGPLGERVELDDRPVVVVDLDLPDVGSGRPLVAAEAGYPRVQRREVACERLNL